LEKRLRGVSTAAVQVLDLSRAKLKDFDDMFTIQTFPALIELNLSENNIVSFRCFGEHPGIKAVHLANNHIDSFFPHDAETRRGLGGLSGLEMIDLSHN
jgi:Leucine-rich repeat (LRR) protein